MAKTVSYTFYSILMPDGVTYWVSGWGKRKLAEKYGVPEKNVSMGANTCRQPHISKYPQKEEA